ncbi:hypothetical protein PRIC1_004993 [Phytophthora ramorum]
MQFSLNKLSLREDSPLPSFSSMFPAKDATGTSPIHASMTLGGLPPLQSEKTEQTDDGVAVAGANEIVTAFESLDAAGANESLLQELQCRYRKGKCPKQRTLKKNGSLHSYCEYHRELSVRNQRVFDQKRRRERGLDKEKQRPCTRRRSDPTGYSAGDVKTQVKAEKRPTRRRRAM